MRESFLETLMYLFENFVTKEAVSFRTKSENIILEMIREGYDPEHIRGALGWFATLDKTMSELGKELEVFGFSNNGIRLYSEEEKQKISFKAREYLSYLSQLNIVDAPVRELIIHCATCCHASIVDLPEIQCISLLILYKYPKKRKQLEMLEYLMLHEEYEETKH